MAIIVGSGQSTDPVYEEFTEKLTQILITSAIRASAAERGATNVRLPEDEKSLEVALRPIFSGTGTRQRLLRSSALRSNLAIRNKISTVDFSSKESVVQQVAKSGYISKQVDKLPTGTKHTPFEVAEYITATYNPHFAELLSSTISPGQKTPTPRPVREVKFMLKSVKCIKQVGWEATDWDLTDKIMCGGLGFDSEINMDSPPNSSTPSNEHFRKVPQFQVGTFKKNGKTKSFKPPRNFCSWPLNSSGNWPRGFFVTMIFAEQDSGDDFPDLLKTLWDLLGPAVKAAIDAAIVGLYALAGGIVGGIAGFAGTPAGAALGAALGAAIGAAIGAFVTFLIDTLRDDILETNDNPMVMFLPSVTDTFPEGDISPTFTANYVRPGMPGDYRIKYYWQLVR